MGMDLYNPYIGDASQIKDGLITAAKLNSAVKIWTVVGDTTVGAGGASNIDFNGIAAGYKEFHLVLLLKNDANADYISLKINNDTTGGRYYTSQWGIDNTANPIQGVTNGGGWRFEYGCATVISAEFYAELDIHNLGTNKKGLFGLVTNDQAGEHLVSCGFYNQTAEISRITIYKESANLLLEGSRAILYAR